MRDAEDVLSLLHSRAVVDALSGSSLRSRALSALLLSVVIGHLHFVLRLSTDRETAQSDDRGQLRERSGGGGSGGGVQHNGSLRTIHNGDATQHEATLPRANYRTNSWNKDERELRRDELADDRATKRTMGGDEKREEERCCERERLSVSGSRDADETLTSC